MALRARYLIGSAVMALAAGLPAGGAALAQDAPIVQPGAPGEAVRQLSAEEAVQIAANRYSDDDVRFMQQMIWHHHQAVQMAALVEGRSSTEALVEIAGRIDASQADEIAFMQGWLRERGETAPDPMADPHAMHAGVSGGHGGAMHGEMAGMASPEQMARLADADGMDFDALFVELMIAHHEGAVEMVAHLLDQRGSAYDPTLFDFANDVRSEQQAEIRRMNALLSGLSQDPRAGLGAGFRDAETAAANMTLLASLPKPTGFFDTETGPRIL